MNADESHDQVALYVVDALAPDERREFESHLAECDRCRDEVAQLRDVTELMSRSVSAEPPASLRAAVLAAVATTPQEPVDDSAGAPAPEADREPRAPEADLEHRASEADLEHRAPVVDIRARISRRAAWLVAAAAVLLAAGFGGWAAQSRHDAQQATSAQSRLVSLLGARDVRTVSGAATGGGSGTVVLSRARHQALFVSTDMPALRDDRVYELWTVRRQAAPAGTFRPSGNGVVVTLPAAALSAQAIAVTVEPAGGSQHPTTTPLVTLPVLSAS